MKKNSKSTMSTKFFINGILYNASDLPYVTSIPTKFFSDAIALFNFRKWLYKNTEDIFLICFHNNTVRFRSKSDATYMKLVFG